MKLSIVLPAYNEEGSIEETLRTLYAKLQEEQIDHEIVVVNDNSKDNTLGLLTTIQETIPTLVVHTNQGPNGFGYAIRYGLERFQGDCVAIMMSDLSDDPADLVAFYRKMVAENLDCVFGSRFIRGGATYDYPKHKYLINRFANTLIRLLLGMSYNDSTNAFKLYKKTTIQGLKPFLSAHFNLTIELPLKAIIRGFSYGVLPNSWRNRKAGESNLKIKEMGSRYLFILLYVIIEKYLSRNDYLKREA
ncbi:glycosyltransferase family 2 protein [Aquirufa regiilacus]|uniref:Glycosyltransferase family 2 protein n=1 Tax=Aquirufa regiilacus TaxID=3024868 RepID=A0ABU3TS61_9BACT|nr:MULTISPECIES: glycosyltransferase family 2 protein [unclassified Aquirufa]MDT8886375.1 glycosyltransferase family 2 protein [Aquirufa sp. LEPPI-3A]MDU0808705.1 glycosyltransferase family 2 protein [Aquirufa sp. LEOWEIH-7C]